MLPFFQRIGEDNTPHHLALCLCLPAKIRFQRRYSHRIFSETADEKE